MPPTLLHPTPPSSPGYHCYRPLSSPLPVSDNLSADKRLGCCGPTQGGAHAHDQSPRYPQSWKELAKRMHLKLQVSTPGCCWLASTSWNDKLWWSYHRENLDITESQAVLLSKLTIIKSCACAKPSFSQNKQKMLIKSMKITTATRIYLWEKKLYQIFSKIIRLFKNINFYKRKRIQEDVLQSFFHTHTDTRTRTHASSCILSRAMNNKQWTSSPSASRQLHDEMARGREYVNM